jgi:hypothetical protein
MIIFLTLSMAKSLFRECIMSEEAKKVNRRRLARAAEMPMRLTVG